MAALQKTRWFGNVVYKVAGSIVLSSGRPIPAQGESRQRGKIVALVLSGSAITAWKDGGRLWKAWNSTLVMVSMKVSYKRCV